MPAQTLLDYLEAGESIDDFLAGFPSVSREQIIRFLEQAKDHGPVSTNLQISRRSRGRPRRGSRSRSIALLAALSKQTSFSVGCYCEDAAHCHRPVLRALLKKAGAKVV